MPEENTNQPVPSPDNIYCPRCGAVQKKGSKFCSECGTSLLPEDKNKVLASDPKIAQKPKSKKKKILIISAVVLGILLIAGGAIGWSLYSRKTKETSEFQNKAKTIWSDVANANDPLKQEIEDAKQTSDFSKISTKISDVQRVIKSKQIETDQLSVPGGSEKTKADMLSALGNHSDYLKNLDDNILTIKDVNKIEDKTLSNVSDLVSKAKTSCQDFVKNNKFIDKNIPDEVFNFSKISGIVNDSKNKTQSEQEAKNKQNQEAQQAADKQASESTVSNFMTNLPNAYASGDPWNAAWAIADKYWLSADMSVFDQEYHLFFDQGPSYSGGRVLSSERLSDTKYNVQAEEKEKLVSYNNFLSYFIVEKVGSGWFITGHGKK